MIPIAEPSLKGNELKYITDAITSGWVSSNGKYVSMFEESFAKFCEVEYSISCSSGTAALHLALVALGIKEGDEVIIPDLTYISTANAVLYVGAKPILVDVDKSTWNIDVNKIEEKITKKTKAIIPVHLYGLPCNMKRIMEIAEKYDLKVIEDCAESLGSKVVSVHTGTLGDIGCFSFFGNKVITTGEGGMCITKNKELDKKMRSLRNQGMSSEKRYWHSSIGFNYRMTNLQGALGVAQLESLNLFLKKKIENAKLYTKLLKNIKGLKIQSEEGNVYWMYCILSDKKDEIIKALNKESIETRPLFIPIHIMPHHNSNQRFPISQDLSNRGLSLPSSVNLKKEEIKRICKIIKGVLE